MWQKCCNSWIIPTLGLKTEMLTGQVSCLQHAISSAQNPVYIYGIQSMHCIINPARFKVPDALWCGWSIILYPWSHRHCMYWSFSAVAQRLACLPRSMKVHSPNPAVCWKAEARLNCWLEALNNTQLIWTMWNIWKFLAESRQELDMHRKPVYEWEKQQQVVEEVDEIMKCCGR